MTLLLLACIATYGALERMAASAERDAANEFEASARRALIYQLIGGAAGCAAAGAALWLFADIHAKLCPSEAPVRPPPAQSVEGV